MRHFRLGLLICAVLVSTSAVVGQGTSAPPSTSDPQAVALIQRALVALNSGAPVSDVTLTGTARRIAGSDDETGTATLKASATQDSRIDLSFPSGNRTEIRNHAALPLPGSLPPGVPASVAQQPQPIGEWLGQDGVRHAMAGHNIMTDPAWFFPAFTLANLATQNYVLSYVGQEALSGGQSVLHVSASRPLVVIPSGVEGSALPAPSIAPLMEHLSRMDLYLDPTSLLPVALAFNVHPDGNGLLDIPSEIRFSNYQATNGVQSPLHVQKFLSNGLVLDLQLSNATLNSGLTASAFQIQ